MIKIKKTPRFSKFSRKMFERSCEKESSSPERRTVSFAQTDTEMEAVTIRSIPALSDMSNEEIKNTWYSDCDFQIMKLSVVQLLRKMIAGTYMHDVNALESEVRGLENKTPEASGIRKKIRYASLVAVLHEQERQRLHGETPDSDYIAKLYCQTCVHSQMKAIRIAANDARVVREDEETVFGESKTFQKIFKSPVAASSNSSAVARSIASPIKRRSSRRLLSMMS